jgi:subtilisin family serine protease
VPKSHGACWMASSALALSSTTALAGAPAHIAPLPQFKPSATATVQPPYIALDLAVWTGDAKHTDVRRSELEPSRGDSNDPFMADAAHEDAPALATEAAPQAFAPSAFETQEYASNWGLGAIGTSTALAFGATGRGVTVGVIDTGIDVNNPEFYGRIHPESRDFYERARLTDEDGHGTGVASVSAGALNASGTHGVAAEATILALRVDEPGSCPPCSLPEDAIARATDHAIANGARVMNYSLAGAEPSGLGLQQSLLAAVAADTVLVFAAGNNGMPHPEYPGRLVSEPWMNGQGIVVGAIDANGALADFVQPGDKFASALPGDAYNYYMVAPGDEIKVAAPGGGYVLGEGTSFAAPHVSGAAAAVISAWPWLAASEVVEILLGTATDLGAPGVDAVYGRGLLNLPGIFSPVGPATLPTGDTVEDAGAPIASANLQTGGAFGRAVASSELLKRAVIIDAYGRDFDADLTRRVAAQGGRVRAEEWAEPQPQAQPFGSKDGAPQTSYAFSRDPVGARFGEAAVGIEIERFALTADVTGTTRYALSRGFGIGDYFGLTNSEDDAVAGLLRRDAFSSPYLGLVENGDGMVLGHGLGAGLELRVGLALQDEEDKGSAPRGERTAYSAELRRTFENGAHLSAQFGVLTEQSGVLGSTAEGAFAIAGESRTRFICLSGRMPRGERIELYGHASVGWTDAGSLTAGVIDNLSSLRTTALGMGAGVREVVAERDRLDITISQPVRVTSGSARISVPTGTTKTGAIVRESERLSLVPDGRQLDLEVAYRASLAPDQELRLNYVAQLEPSHDADAETEHFFGVRYALKF